VTHVLHVIDATCDDTTFQVLRLLRARLQADAGSQPVCSVDGHAWERATGWLGPGVARAEHRHLVKTLLYSPRLATIAGGAGARLVHAWGLQAADLACVHLPKTPLLLTLLDPQLTRDAGRWVRSLPTRAIVAAHNQVTRTRLLAAGLPPENVVVIRGGVDFAAINAARKEDARWKLAGDARPVVLLHGPPSRPGGQFYGLWSAAIVAQIHRGMRVLMPYASTESDRLGRFLRRIRMPEMVRAPRPPVAWTELVSAADVFLAPALDEICTEPLATAMAAGLPIVASAVRSVAELLADRHNGLLCKPGEPRAMAAKLLLALEDEGLRRKIADTARAQAYEVFSVRAMADNYARLYKNLLAGRPAAEGIHDTAMVA
jgi:hypothetical protein